MAAGPKDRMSSPYRIELDLFTGPLDLLLYLVRRNELDVADLAIAEITRQFQEFLEVLRELDLDLIGDFVVMASTLVEIKSRTVLPSPEEEAEEAAIETQSGDPRSDLIDQLMEYRKFKEAALALERHAEIWQERYPRLSDERPRSGRRPIRRQDQRGRTLGSGECPQPDPQKERSRDAIVDPLRRNADPRVC